MTARADARARRSPAHVLRRAHEEVGERVAEGPPSVPMLPKSPTGIAGLDEVTWGGLPAGRPTLVCGGPGSGKTMLCIQFLVEGIRKHGENAVFMPFEEQSDDLAVNAASLGFDLDDLVKQDRLRIDHIDLNGVVGEGGGFDLEALFIRIRHAVDQVGAKRIAFDTLDHLFAGLPNRAVLRAEVHRLFRWLKDQGLTAVVTAEAGKNSLTRDGMEEYVSDCVIFLEQNIVEQVATRRLRIIKYRGSMHGTNQYPFAIDENGFSVVPITGAALRSKASDDRISLGVPGIDEMLGGKGVYRGTTLLITGTAGTGKTTLAAHIADASCARGERATFYSFEQAADAIMRDTGALGGRLSRWVQEDMLRFEGSRPTSQGIDRHLASMRRHIREFQPQMVILDPITGFGHIGATWETRDMLTLLVDIAAEVGATLVMTSLTAGGAPAVATDVRISSLADVWILLEDLQEGGQRERVLAITKARGIGHSKFRHATEIDDDGMRIGGPHMHRPDDHLSRRGHPLDG